MKFKNPYWDAAIKIQLLQRWVLVHSYLYYTVDKPVISDSMYDENCLQLFEMMEDEGREIDSKYNYAFGDFDGSTGFNLTNKLSAAHYRKIMEEANLVVSLVNERNGVCVKSKRKAKAR